MIKTTALALLLFLLIGYGMLAKGQQVNVVYTPDVYAMAKQTFSPVSLYTGQVNVEIPLYTIKTKGISVPISITCDNSGLKKSRRSGFIGLNWNLKCGGAVMRIINEWRDDDNLHGGANINGSLCRKNRNITNGFLETNFESFFSGAESNLGDHLIVPKPFEIAGAGTDEYAPDLFVFNVLGYSGAFFIGNDGKIKVRSEHHFMVQYDRLAQKEDGKIILTGPDGITFTFGGDRSSIDYCYSGDSQSSKELPITWRLTKIVDVNGNEVKFNYYDPANKKDAMLPVSVKVPQGYAYTITSLIESIDFPEGQVTFHKKDLVYDRDSKICIESISATTKRGEIVKTILFDQCVISSYLILNSVRVGNERYKFTYYNLNRLPIQNELGGDYWGYSNGVYGSGPAFGRFFLGYNDENQKQEYLNRFAINFEHTLSGNLRFIEYPTGGKEEFTYEQNTYNYFYTKSQVDNYIQLEQRSYKPIECGGVRIKTHVLSGNGTILSKKEYRYQDTYKFGEKEYNPESQSPIEFSHNGTLHKLPSMMWLFGCNYSELEDESGSHVSYPAVVTIEDNGSYTISHFTSARLFPDRIIGALRYDSYFVKNINNIIEKTFRYTSFSFLRGKLISTEVYDKNNRPLKKENFEYDLDLEKTQYYVGCIGLLDLKVTNELQTLFQSGDRKLKQFANTYRMYYHTPHLKKYTSSVFGDDGVEIKTVTEYQYDSIKNRVYEKQVGSKNEVRESIYRYATDILSNTSSSGQSHANVQGLTALKDRHMIGIPVEKEQRVNGKTVAAHVTLFKQEKGIPVADSKWSMSSFKEANYKPLKVNSTGLVKDERLVKHESFDMYDSWGNILQITNRDGITSSFLWDSLGEKVLAEAKNITYDELLLAGGTPPVSTVEGEIGNYLNQLRTNLSSRSCMLNTYIYKPMVGLSKKESSCRLTNEFEYDTQGRLSTVKEKQNIVAAYHYNFFNTQRNERVEKKYYKQNCPRGEAGGAITYTVPEGKYFSSVDKADANRQALEEADRNGQQMANEQSKCFFLNTSTYQLSLNKKKTTTYTTFTISSNTTWRISAPDWLMWGTSSTNPGVTTIQVRPLPLGEQPTYSGYITITSTGDHAPISSIIDVTM